MPNPPPCDNVAGFIDITQAPYNAPGGGQTTVATLSWNSGTSTLSSSTGIWASGDVGGVIRVDEANVGTLSGTIGIFTDPSHIVLTNVSAPPGFSLSGTSTRLSWGPDNSPAFSSFNSANIGSSVNLYIPAGVYVFGGTPFIGTGLRALTICGYGATLAGGISWGDTTNWRQSNFSAFTNTTVVGSNSLILIDPTQYARFSVGQWCILSSVDMQTANGFPPNPFNYEFLTISSVSSNGVVVFNQAIQYVHKSTYPNFNEGGPQGGAHPSANQGGASLLLGMSDGWNLTLEVRGLTLVPNTGQALNVNARTYFFIDCSGADVGVNISITQSASLINCNFPNWGIEVDKVIGSLTITGTTLSQIQHQSSAPLNLLMNNCTVSNGLNGTPRNVNISNTTFSGTSFLGPNTYGRTDVLIIDNCSFSAVTWDGPGVNNVAGTFTLSSGGVLSMPLYVASSGVSYWGAFVPGTYCHFNADYDNEDAQFLVTDLTTDGRAIYAVLSINSGQATLTSSAPLWSTADQGKPIQVGGAGISGAALNTTILAVNNSQSLTLAANASTTLSSVEVFVAWGSGYIHTSGLGASWPPLPTASGLLNVRALPVRTSRITRCVGCAAALNLSNSGAYNKPIYEYYNVTFMGDGIRPSPNWEPPQAVWGKIVSIKINVVKAYSGTLGTAYSLFPFVDTPILLSNNTTFIYNSPVIDLKTVGMRTITPQGATSLGADSGLALPVDSLLWLGTTIQLNSNYDVTVENSSVWPIVNMEIITDQGFGDIPIQANSQRGMFFRCS